MAKKLLLPSNWCGSIILLTEFFGYVSNTAFLGCFRDADIRTLPDGYKFSLTMDNPKCIDFCRNAGLVYAGTEFRQECYCGDQSRLNCSLELPIEYCPMVCGGDFSDNCGGSWALTVHWTGIGTPIPCEPTTEVTVSTTAISVWTTSEETDSITTAVTQSTTQVTAGSQQTCNNCHCIPVVHYTNMSQQELDIIINQKIETIKRHLEVVKNSTTAYTRTKISATDDRTSSKVMGLVSVVFLSVVFGSVVMSDLVSCIYVVILHLKLKIL